MQFLTEVFVVDSERGENEPTIFLTYDRNHNIFQVGINELLRREHEFT